MTKTVFMKTKEMKLILIRGVLLVVLSLYFMVVFGQSTEVVAFHANRSNSDIALQWELAPENKISTVVIERKTADDEFKAIAEFWVNFDGNTERNFKYADKKVKSKTAQYRLKIVNQSGDVKYTDVLQLDKGVDKNTITSPTKTEDADVEYAKSKRSMLAAVKINRASEADGFKILLKLKLQQKAEENNLL